MNFRISDTFTASLARLTREEQKAFKTTDFDLQQSPANPGMSFQKLDKARVKNYWSVRVSCDILVAASASTCLLRSIRKSSHGGAVGGAQQVSSL